MQPGWQGEPSFPCLPTRSTQSHDWPEEFAASEPCRMLAPVQSLDTLAGVLRWPVWHRRTAFGYGLPLRPKPNVSASAVRYPAWRFSVPGISGTVRFEVGDEIGWLVGRLMLFRSSLEDTRVD